MTIRILNRTVAALSAAVILSACGGGGDSAEGRASDPSAQSQGLVYAFPGDGQTEVSTASPVILRFTSSVNVGDAMNGITLYEGGADGRAMSPEFEPVQGQPNNLMLVPEENDPFKPNQQYTLVIEDLPLGGNGTAENRTLQFTTRALHEGPKELVVTDMDDFRITGAFPNFDNDNLGGEQRFQAMDFSSFRFQMSQPVDRATAVYGESVTLTYGPDDTEVPATLLVDGRYLTVDPEPEYLDPSQTYELTLTGDLASTYGANFTERSLRFKPQDTSPRGEPTRLVQRLTVNEPSKLTGRDVNTVPVNGTLLGEDENVTQARADSVIAELGDATVFSRTTPIRLPKGTVLKGDAINPILIGGKVPAGFGSGEVTMTLLSDATGYLVQNRYMEDGENVSRMIQLMMDVGIATAEPRANGAFTQDLLHIELVGLADIDTSAGVLNVDAVSVVEPDILGQEYGYGLLSFQLQSYEDQTNAPQPIVDNSALSLQSWMPGENQDLQAPGQPIILNFNKQLDPKSLEGSITLQLNGEDIPFDYYADGSALVINPNEEQVLKSGASLTVRHLNGLQHSEEGNERIYSLAISGISALPEGGLDSDIQETFSLPVVVKDKQVVIPNTTQPILDDLIDHSPVVLSSYPGFPCALENDGRDLASGFAGKCQGAFGGIDDGTEFDNQPADDSIPVMTMPGRRPIIVQFSEEMNLETITLGGTFKIEEVESDGTSIKNVPGRLELFSKSLRFTPNAPWNVGSFYRYSLASSGYTIGQDPNGIPKMLADSDYQCGETAICDMAGLPLQTQVVGITTIEYIGDTGNERDYAVFTTGPEFNAGGPVMEQFFEGAEANNNVVQILNTMPVSDTNHNFFHERSNVGTSTNPGRSFGVYDYDVEEYGPTNISESASAEFDPNGVKPAKNSSKILSRYRSQDEAGVLVNGANLGCDYVFPTDQPLECPDQKFTYLSAGLIAEVTDELMDGALKVLIWPSQVVGTSIPLFGLADFGIFIPNPGVTGPQFLRMRFAPSGEVDGAGNEVRNQPIVAWIKDDPEDGLTLETELDLYVTAPYVTEYGVGSSANSSNLGSYPITMKMSGPVSFLDDGRMVVEQMNMEDVDIFLKLHGRKKGDFAGYVDLFIPGNGTRLNFVSEPIK
ncbi:Ig-like domain-containing protein [Alcanivorax marinus]|uniref:Ig-like domain-containing protein n=1 Tax=Alloalcanivorax marinus TaxID=1177169 RepID=A0A9Q3UNH1_9GAMM|nr:Ig-like domain-containing protein [Alloalcanivorax marinus]MCC4310566.1 Ig-like domain-containing protein [Alloalcanivorax marinus]MCU5785765.1 hypothetical protein [Alloalcanivorax marinus]